MSYEYSRRLGMFDIELSTEQRGRLDGVRKILAGISGGYKAAVGHAMARTAQHAESIAAKTVSERYAVSQSVIGKNMRHVRHTVTDSGAETEITISYCGNVIPLLQFDTTAAKKGGVSARVKRVNARERLDRVFGASVGEHRGLFERVGYNRFPVEEKFGPSAPQGLAEEIEYERGGGGTSGFERKALDTFDKRLEHEVLRLLNGWGR
jgi:hypothetical protein